MNTPLGASPIDQTPPDKAPACLDKCLTPSRGTTTPNETARWLGEHLTPPRGCQESRLYKMLRTALYSRLPLSGRRQMVEDHIQNYMLRAIRRNALKRLIDEGDVPYSKVVAYTVNSGRTDIRDMGTEPVCREMYGARTEKERLQLNQATDGDLLTGPLEKGTRDTDGNIAVGTTTEIPDTAIDFDVVWSRIQEVVRTRKPQAWERYSNILALRAQGYSTKEIARAQGVSRNRAASMLADARRCVREGYAEGQLDGYIQIDLRGSVSEGSL